MSWSQDVTIKVEAAFGDDPFTESSWTTIAGDVRGMVTKIGRTQELDQYPATRATFTISNTSADFDTLNTAGAYWPDVKLGVPLRVQGIHSGTTYAMWYGYVDSLPQMWRGKSDATVKLSATQGSGFLASAKTSVTRSAEGSGARVAALLDTVSWSTLRDLDAGLSTLAASTYIGVPVLSAIRKAAEGESGLFRVGPSGRAEFRDRYDRIDNWTTSAVTFGDSSTEAPYFDVKFGYDGRQVWNQVEVTRSGSTNTQTATSTGSEDTYRTRTLTKFDVPVGTDNEAEGVAQWLLESYREPVVRVQKLVIRPEKAPSTLYPEILGLVLDERVTVNRRAAGDDISEQFHVEGVTHTLTPDRWTTNLLLSPASTATYWVLGVSTLGSGTRLAPY